MKKYKFLDDSKWYSFDTKENKYNLEPNAPSDVVESYLEYCWDTELSSDYNNEFDYYKFRDYIHYLENFHNRTIILNIITLMCESGYISYKLLIILKKFYRSEFKEFNTNNLKKLEFNFFQQNDIINFNEEDNNQVSNILKRNISEVKFSVRALNGLINNEILTIEDLIELNYIDIISLKNIGKKTANEIIQVKESILKELEFIGYKYHENEFINDNDDKIDDNASQQELDSETLYKLLTQETEENEIDKYFDSIIGIDNVVNSDDYDFEDFFQKFKKERTSLDLININNFSKKWIELFKSSHTVKYDIIEGTLGDECKELGFINDNGEGFIKKYGLAYSNNKVLKSVIRSIEDLDLLGSALYSNWRYFNHWADSSEDILSPANRTWFLIILRRIKELSEN